MEEESKRHLIFSPYAERVGWIAIGWLWDSGAFYNWGLARNRAEADRMAATSYPGVQIEVFDHPLPKHGANI